MGGYPVMGANPHNPGGRGLGELPRAELEARVLESERRARDTLVAFRDLSRRFRDQAAELEQARARCQGGARGEADGAEGVGVMDRDEIRKACEQASPGPWQWVDGYDTLSRTPVGREGTPAEGGLYGPGWDLVVGGGWRNDGVADCEASDADVAFIAGAREWVPALLAENEKLREALDRARESLRDDLLAEALHYIAAASGGTNE